MSQSETIDEAIDALRELGLKEYEAKCFVGLSRLSSGTARRISEVTEVPRTRVYEAIRVLEAKGLVEIQHSSPQQYRSVPLDEAIETLRSQTESHIDQLKNALDSTEYLDQQEQETAQEVWSITGQMAIANRTAKLIEDAESEVVLVLGHPQLFTAEIADRLRDVESEVDLIIGAVTPELAAKVQEELPNADTFVSGLDWLQSPGSADSVAIGHLLLTDETSILVSSLGPGADHEMAIFGTGFNNGLVVIARRLMAQGLKNQ